MSFLFEDGGTCAAVVPGLKDIAITTEYHQGGCNLLLDASDLSCEVIDRQEPGFI